MFRENHKIVQAFASIDINGAAQTGDYVCMKDAEHLTIIISAGVIGGTCNITVNKATGDAVGATAMTVNYAVCTAPGTSDALVKATASASIATGTTNRQVWVIEIEASELGDTYDWVNVNISDNCVARRIYCNAPGQTE